LQNDHYAYEMIELLLYFIDTSNILFMLLNTCRCQPLHTCQSSTLTINIFDFFLTKKEPQLCVKVSKCIN